MSAGSDASNLGYGKIAPLSNIKGSYVNVDNSHSPGPFGSNQIPGTPPGPLSGLAGTKNNVDAAAGIYPGSSILFKGGAKNLKRKIKNITKKYKMKGGSRKRHSLRKKIRSKYSRLSRSRHRRRTYKQRGGYAQYQNNLPMTPTYSTGGFLRPSDSALANPAPFTRLTNCVNCVDNYNHFTNKGFPSRGH